jgi:hypothetical protein
MRWGVINTLLRGNRQTFFLEIGTGPARYRSLQHVLSDVKITVDPGEADATFRMPSDSFFKLLLQFNAGKVFDVIFIDGLHIREQVLKDVENALLYLKERGAIVVHDCAPATEGSQRPYPVAGEGWNGDVWKAWVDLRVSRADLSMCVVNCDQGCGVIKRGSQKTLSPIRDEDLTFDLLQQKRNEFLNLIPFDVWLKENT